MTVLTVSRSLGWLAALVLSYLVGGWWALGAAVVATAALESRRVSARAVAIAATIAMTLVPVVWLLSNASRLGDISFALVQQAPWPGRLALVALVWLVISVTFDVLASHDHDEP